MRLRRPSTGFPKHFPDGPVPLVKTVDGVVVGSPGESLVSFLHSGLSGVNDL